MIPAQHQPDLLAGDALDPSTWADDQAPAGQPQREIRAVSGGPKRAGKGSSPTQRSLKHLRDNGYVAEVVEKWNPHSRTRKDLFGFGDIVAIRRGEVLLVQATSRANVAARVTKIAEAELVNAVREAGIRIEVHGWAKMASGRYELRVEDVS